MIKFIEMLSFLVDHSSLDMIRCGNMAHYVGWKIKLNRIEKFEHWNGYFKSLETKLASTENLNMKLTIPYVCPAFINFLSSFTAKHTVVYLLINLKLLQ